MTPMPSTSNTSSTLSSDSQPMPGALPVESSMLTSASQWKEYGQAVASASSTGSTGSSSSTLSPARLARPTQDIHQQRLNKEQPYSLSDPFSSVFSDDFAIPAPKMTRQSDSSSQALTSSSETLSRDLEMIGLAEPYLRGYAPLFPKYVQSYQGSVDILSQYLPRCDSLRPESSPKGKSASQTVIPRVTFDENSSNQRHDRACHREHLEQTTASAPRQEAGQCSGCRVLKMELAELRTEVAELRRLIKGKDRHFEAPEYY
jgi:hypothetical protein